MRNFLISAVLAAMLCTAPLTVSARGTCAEAPGYAVLKAALKDAVAQKNGGWSLPMWGAIVDRSGIICAIVYSGDTVDAQWPGSRLIALQKAYTANAFSLPNLALSTANLYSATQPGGSMFGLQSSNPVNAAAAYSGDVSTYGTENDILLRNRIGGINVFGGGLALYNEAGDAVGGLGVSGDSSCADHNIAWRMRSAMKLDFVPAGIAPDKSDQIIYDISNNVSQSGWGHPACAGIEKDVAKTLPPVEKKK